MNIQLRRSLVDQCINDERAFHRCCQKNYLSATVQDRGPFDSEEFYSSVGSREILAIFKAGEKYTPEDRALDIYLPKNIETGTYPLNSPDQLIEIAFTEFLPPYTSYWASEGVMNLSVNADTREYAGTFDVKFKDRQNHEFVAEGTFCFCLEN
ncbi:hypothetical protein PMA3_24045 [Pseudomonas silesiensis]|uniref:Uncharacterized protein n=1 Tax=Pseudomonas silesiensis TaxID=1853130 RepID=A0A191YYU6_9PSED|nr:hypothetical protein [Pseudomonas silesiensis]ANJ58070.1 hypothetical protein PMA3_24045 [Pseudomonas silesiensis]